ncbi:Pi-transporter A-1 [Cryptococcus bacillisporus CA1873]|uniref:Pi-transporter A-1 n=2 Tax=Cryptococcus gattii TaxID=552467 RepID=A0A0D0U7P7_CRYGA|nr:Pi-transporter A-1 [Cryptococcus bacillisporus CA1280]KIR57991.1 Pi-transporter A-1 [Cryptococcus bacillisporus CA1873]|eukprot:KIR57991.1 Pi-transporter A-1 [Cryptococcus gattii CA1873]
MALSFILRGENDQTPMIAPGDVPSPTIISLTNTPAIPPTQPLINPPNPSSDDDGALPPSRFSLDPEKRDPRLSSREFDQSHPLFQDLAPEDSYRDGVYWADLPFNERRKWVDSQSNEEARRELKHIWQMFKEDPLSPLTTYCKTYVMGGFGLFTEGYALFSIGNLSALYKAVWPHCWKTHEVCSANWIAAVDYLQIIGIIVGQILVGIEGDWIGRKFGLVQDALIMTLGLVMLTSSWGTSLEGWVICYGFSQFFYGIGVGGEYPMTSTTAMESKSVAGSQKNDKLHRGRNVVLTFLMQGWGQLFNQAILIILLLIFHHSGNPPYSTVSAQWTYRVSFGIMAVMTLWLAYFRFYKKKYTSAALRRSKKNMRVNQSGYDLHSLKLVGTHFAGRLVGTTLGWLFNDFLFYGNKLFASTFIEIISPNAAGNVIVTWNWNMVNIGVSLCGYYLAAFLIDHKFYGRKRMQIIGFLGDAVLFMICAIWYTQLSSPAHIKGFQTIYYLSSFFQQFGPNCTTFLLAAEVFPVSVRATAHGLSAASGKIGALLPAVIYNYVDTHTRFWIVFPFGFAGVFVTLLFIPDTTGLDLREQDRYWAYVRQGRAHEYHGIAVHPRHLSWWEKIVLKRHLAYNPEKDRMQRVRELRMMYEEKRRAMEEVHEHEEHEEEMEDELSHSAYHHFNSEYQDLIANSAPSTSPNSPRPFVGVNGNVPAVPLSPISPATLSRLTPSRMAL